MRHVRHSCDRVDLGTMFCRDDILLGPLKKKSKNFVFEKKNCKKKQKKKIPNFFFQWSQQNMVPTEQCPYRTWSELCLTCSTYFFFFFFFFVFFSIFSKKKLFNYFFNGPNRISSQQNMVPTVHGRSCVYVSHVLVVDYLVINKNFQLRKI